MKVDNVFDSNGEILFDPFRCDRVEDPMYNALFDEEGNLLPNAEKQIKKLVKTNNWSPWCTAVGLIHADKMACGTKGNYSTIYYFR